MHNDSTHCYGVSIAEFERVNAGWAYLELYQTSVMEICAKIVNTFSRQRLRQNHLLKATFGEKILFVSKVK